MNFNRLWDWVFFSLYNQLQRKGAATLRSLYAIYCLVNQNNIVLFTLSVVAPKFLNFIYRK